MFDINIVIATFNSAETLQRCLESVRAIAQNQHCNVILIDGGSTDNTLNIANRYRDIITVIESAPDDGVYDAWNKGLRYIRGPWVLFLGSDDYLLPTRFLDYMRFANGYRDVDFISCRVTYVDKHNNPLRVVGSPWDWERFQRYMVALHPGSLTSSRYLERVGGFDSGLQVCGDYDLLLRGGPHLKTAHWPDSPVCMQVGGLSDGILAIREQFIVKLRAGYRRRDLCAMDFAIGVFKYYFRKYWFRSR